MSATILVTVASGFVGDALMAATAARHFRQALRQPALHPRPDDIVVGDIGHDTDWGPALYGVDCVVHVAARTHILGKDDAEALAMYHDVNVEGISQLSRHHHKTGSPIKEILDHHEPGIAASKVLDTLKLKQEKYFSGGRSPRRECRRPGQSGWLPGLPEDDLEPLQDPGHRVHASPNPQPD